jgi:predicted  nucleic acid-binding Zn-ribbon protein
MTLRLEGLLQLQQLDHQKSVFRERLAQLPIDLEKLRQRVEAARQAKAQTQDAIEQCQKQRRTKEGDLQTQEERLAKLKTRLGEIKTNKEYQAHLTEIDTAKQAQVAIEDELLVFMERTETLTQELKVRGVELSAVETAAAADEARLAGERQQVEQQLEQLGAETTRLEQAVDPALLKGYQRLHQRLRGAVIVPIQSGGCTGCQLAVPPQLIAEVRRQEVAQHCPHCGRFLYWPHAG